MSSCLDAILGPGGLTVRFQPILEMRHEMTRLHSVESLVRGPKGTNMESAEILFDYVRRKHEESRVDRACVAAVCEAARSLPKGMAFSINVNALTLARDPDFVPYLLDTASRHLTETPPITLEIVEHAPAWVFPKLAKALHVARQLGFRIALDDVGLGQANYQMILDCEPDYLKIDRYFIAGCHRDSHRRAVLESLVHLAQGFGAQVVAEGVERWPDLETAMSAGIVLFQGYLLCSPVPHGELARGKGSLTPGRALRGGASGLMQPVSVPSS